MDYRLFFTQRALLIWRDLYVPVLAVFARVGGSTGGEAAQVESAPAPVVDAPDTTTPKTQTEDPTKLEDTGDEG